MMRRIVFIISFLFPMLLWASERSVGEAAQLAAEFMNEQFANAPQRVIACDPSSLLLTHTRAKLHNDSPAFYVFNQTDKTGFIVVSADDRTEDVLMYSHTGELDVNNANPNVKFWLNYIQEQISAANDTNAVNKSATRKLTNDLPVLPLLVNKEGRNITWYQESPYWNNCPMKNKSRCLTGCVATAAAQVMYKWRHPVQGTGSHSYSWNSKILSKDFSSVTFDWDNILPAYSGKITTDAQNAAVAELMYCCGVACDMEYGNSDDGGSGSLTDRIANGMEQYLGYTFDKFVTTFSKKDYPKSALADNRCHWSVTMAELIDYFNADLDEDRPVIMGGYDEETGGHEFVCDGRDMSGRFHINWGWEGESNCYCSLSLLNPYGTLYNFSSYIDAIIGLRPVKDDTVHVTSVSVSPDSATIKINEKVTLMAVVMPANATLQQVSWSCDNLKVLSVNSKGVVMGVGTGTAHVTATSEDGGKKAHAVIKVTNEVEQGLEDVANDNLPVNGGKIVTDGQLYIPHGGRVYNAQGQLVR